MGEVKGEIEGGIKPTGALCLKDFRHLDGRDEASFTKFSETKTSYMAYIPRLGTFDSQRGNISFPVWEFIL